MEAEDSSSKASWEKGNETTENSWVGVVRCQKVVMQTYLKRAQFEWLMLLKFKQQKNKKQKK